MNSFQTPLSYQNIPKNTLNINAKVYESPKQYQKQQFFSPLSSQPSFQKGNIVEVYEDNFVKEIKRIGKFLNSYPYIGMDTEFPGTVYPCTSYTTDFYYQFTKANVDHLKLIQLGVTLFNKKGEYPPYISTWQFNLKYDYTKDEHSNQSISMLANCGINFEKLKNKGIHYDLFAEYFRLLPAYAYKHKRGYYLHLPYKHRKIKTHFSTPSFCIILFSILQQNLIF